MRFETSVVVDRPIDEVWAFFGDLFNVPRWTTGALRFRQTSPGPLGLGSTIEARAAMFGFEPRVTGTVTEWDPPHAVTLSCVGAGWRSLVMQMMFESTAHGTKVVRVTDGTFGPIWKLLWPILGPWARHRSEATNQRIKRILEAERH